jgi:hypothetical protein
MNCKAIRCTSRADLPEAMKEFLESDGNVPILLECEVEKNEHVFPSELGLESSVDDCLISSLTPSIVSFSGCRRQGPPRAAHPSSPPRRADDTLDLNLPSLSLLTFVCHCLGPFPFRCIFTLSIHASRPVHKEALDQLVSTISIPFAPSARPAASSSRASSRASATTRTSSNVEYRGMGLCQSDTSVSS